MLKDVILVEEEEEEVFLLWLGELEFVVIVVDGFCVGKIFFGNWFCWRF